MSLEQEMRAFGFLAIHSNFRKSRGPELQILSVRFAREVRRQSNVVDRRQRNIKGMHVKEHHNPTSNACLICDPNNANAVVGFRCHFAGTSRSMPVKM